MGGTRIAMISPQTPDCRGGVFAVFAKISPPTRFTIREDSPAPAMQTSPPRRPIHHTPSREPCIRGFKIRPQACAHATCGGFPIQGFPGALPSRRGAGDRDATNDTSAQRDAARHVATRTTHRRHQPIAIDNQKPYRHGHSHSPQAPLPGPHPPHLLPGGRPHAAAPPPHQRARPPHPRAAAPAAPPAGGLPLPAGLPPHGGRGLRARGAGQPPAGGRLPAGAGPPAARRAGGDPRGGGHRRGAGAAVRGVRRAAGRGARPGRRGHPAARLGAGNPEGVRGPVGGGVAPGAGAGPVPPPGGGARGAGRIAPATRGLGCRYAGRVGGAPGRGGAGAVRLRALRGDRGHYHRYHRERDAVRHVATNAPNAQRDAARHVATNNRHAYLPLRGGGSAGRPAAPGAAETALRPGVPPPPAGGHLLRATTTMRGRINPAARMVKGAGSRGAFVATWRAASRSLSPLAIEKSPFYQLSRLLSRSR